MQEKNSKLKVSHTKNLEFKVLQETKLSSKFHTHTHTHTQISESKVLQGKASTFYTLKIKNSE